MKVVILHPPIYPVDHKFFNLLGKFVDLVVYNFGAYPKLHTTWKSSSFDSKENSYKMRFFGKGAIDLKTQSNPLLFAYLLKDRPDVVISVAFWIPSLYASLVKNILNFKFVIKTDAIDATDKNISNFRYKMRKLICKNTDTFISASDLTTEYLKNLCSKVRVDKSLQTIDIGEWKSSIEKLSDKASLREELEIHQDKTILLGVGGFTYKKNWIAVFKQMKFLQDCIFILIGHGEDKEKYEDYIAEHNLENIKILSRKDGLELVKYYKASDIFIFASLYDQFGYVVPEALASKLPVICSKSTGASSLITNGYNGFVVDPQQEFYKEINKIILNLKTFQNNAYNSIKDISLESKVKEYIKILDLEKI